MLTKLFDFFQLFCVTDGSLMLGLSLPILEANMLLYFADFYHMVKRKSRQETMALLCIPCLAVFTLSFFAMTFVRVPKPGELGAFLTALSEPGLSLSLLMVSALYVLLWLSAYIFKQKYGRRQMVSWILSSIPDFIFCFGIVAGSLGRLALGMDFLTAYGQRVVWLYLYCIYFLACKIILLIVFTLISLYSMRLPFRWKEGRNPVFFLSRYFLFYQNAMARNTLLFGLIILAGVLVPLVLFEDETTPEQMFLIVGTLVCCIAIIFFCSTIAVRTGLRQFLRWGNEYRVKELFCREYFTQEPLYQDSQYTVTRHFLIAEQYPALVYFWGKLCRVSDRHIDKDGECSQLSFADGQTCRMSIQEALDSRPVFEYAKSLLENGTSLKEDWLQQSSAVLAEDTSAKKMKSPSKIIFAAAVISLVFVCAAYGFYRQTDLYAYIQELKIAGQFYEDGRYLNAMEHYKEALGYRPDSVEAADGYFDARLALARENLSIGGTSDTLYSWLIKKRPQESYLYLEEAQVYLIGGKYTKALELLHKGYEMTQDQTLLEKEAYVREHIVATYKKETQLQRPTIIYTYDHNGNLLTEDEYYASTSGECYSSNQYTYDENQRVIKKYYSFSMYTGYTWEESSEYFYDSNGREWARVTWHDTTNNAMWLWSCRYLSYDAMGRLTRVEYSDGNDDNPQAFMTAERSLDEIHVYEEQADGGLLEVTTTLHPLAEYSFYSDEPYVYSVQVTQYDTAGNCVEIDKYIKNRDENDEYLLNEDSVWKITAAQAQNLRARDWMNILETLDLEDNQCDTKCLKKIWKYDSNGNEIFYEGNSMTKLFEYDEEQHLISEIILDDSGKPALTYDHQYNELGLCTKTRITDERNGTTGYRYINYEYEYAYTGEPLWEAEFGW